LALKGANEELKNKIFKNVPKRAAKLLLEDIDYLGHQWLSDVEQVQQEIIEVIYKLEDAGEISFPSMEEWQKILDNESKSDKENGISSQT